MFFMFKTSSCFIGRKLIRYFTSCTCFHKVYKRENSNRMTISAVPYKLAPIIYTNFRFYTMDDKWHKKEAYNSDYLLQEMKTRDTNWNRMKVTLITFATLFGMISTYLIYTLGSPKRDEEGNIIEDEFSTLSLPIQYLLRMYTELEHFHTLMKQPISDKLLPDPLKYQPQYTLILEMNDLLVHADWTFQTGWRFKKRPGLDQFLELVTGPMFELVIFTVEDSRGALPLLEALDPNGYISHKLSREATELVDGHYVKNLSYLNRDLSKVIMVDWNKNSVKYHKENTLLIPRWHGQDNDTTLIDLVVFLKAIVDNDIEDVREVLSYYTEFENPLEIFIDNQRKVLGQMEQDERQKETNFASKWANSFLKPHRT